jgi:serine/threonine-protein kinase
MDKHRLQRLAHLFDTAVDLPTAARAAFIDAEAGDDATLRAELARLLARDERLASARTVSVVDRLASELPDLVAERDWRGVRVGQYQLDEEIGRGGMGRVYRARRVDGAFDREVAVKLVARDALNPALLKRFSTERAVLAALDHPGICRLLDAGAADDGTPWVAMDLIRGAPITTWCDARRLDLAGRVALFRKVLAAASHAHRNLVVHRDIKPSNVLVDDDGQPHLLDFGIAKPLHSAEPGNPTATAERYFTLTHAAPEQWRGGPVTVACDVYALGVLLHELLAGAPPFEFRDLSPGRIEALILDTPAPPPSRTAGERDDAGARARGLADSDALRRALRGDLDAIVQRALRKEADARYPSVEQFDADLAAWLEGRPVAARGGHGWYRARKFVGRHRWAVAGAAAVAVTVLVATLVVAAQTVEVRRERDRAEQAVDFLKDAFLAADPARSVGGDVTARQIMAAARSDLAQLRERQPDLYAELAGTIAEVELTLGLTESAGELAGSALESGVPDGPAAQSLRLLTARADVLAGRLDEAERTLVSYVDAGGTDSAELLVVRGGLRMHRGDGAGGLADLRRAVALTADAPATSRIAFRARIELANQLRGAGEPDAALATTAELIDRLGRSLPTSHPYITLARMRHGDMLRRVGRHDEAVREARAAREAIERDYGRDVPVYASALNTLGNALGDAGDAAGAVEAYREAAERYAEQLGADHATTIRTRYNFALALAVTDPSAADETFANLIAAADGVFGAESTTPAFFRAGFANALLEQRRPDAALATLLDIPDAVFAASPEAVKALMARAREEACGGKAAADADCARASGRSGPAR